MSRFKTELCNNLLELGTCKYGDRCHYAHGAHELRQVSKRHPKYRTEKCKNFELTGKCPFGPRCSYVHPKPDLDSMIEQLTKYMKHTKAPKPDSEDDDDLSLFARTDSSVSISRDSANTNNGDDEQNKENLELVLDYKKSNPNQSELVFNRNLQAVNQNHYNSSTIQTRNHSSTHYSSQTHNNHFNQISGVAATVSSQASTPLMRTPLSTNSNSCNILTPLNPNRQLYTRF